MNMTDNDKATITAALHLAAEEWSRCATIQLNANNHRLQEQFIWQAQDARRLIETIDNANSITIQPEE